MLNIAGLMAIGISLLMGIKVRWGCVAGILLPCFLLPGASSFSRLPQGSSEGSYWIVNKNLIEIAALLVILQFPLTAVFGLENLWMKKNKITVQNE
jgi:thiosulfate dehydrogenase [quinone] large subunit